jgi:uncharacterized protein (TIGR03435 family)
MMFADARTILAASGTCFVLSASLAFAQTATAPPQSPTFEVASIRQNIDPNHSWRMNFTPNGVSALDVTLQYAIHEAYGLYDDRLWSGGPSWLTERRFDIEAKYDTVQYPHPTLVQRQAMLQQLLAERFKLAVHHESNEFPLYALVVAKNGPKFQESKPDELHPNKVYGSICHVTRSRPGILGLEGCTMVDLARLLTGWTHHDLGRTIVDHTGLTARYTLLLQWTPENASQPAAQDTEGPFLFTALKEQLGLELKATTGPLDTIVIDHVEMPSEN